MIHLLEPRNIICVSGFPDVVTTFIFPSSLPERNACDCDEESIASTAIFTLPSVPFLKPIGQGSPDASSRWVWDSAVLAPIAPQLMRSEKYRGESGSRNSVAVGILISVISNKSFLAVRSHSSIICDSSRWGSFMSHFHPTVVRGFSKYVRITISRVSQNSSLHFWIYPAYSIAAFVSWIEHGPTITKILFSFPCIIEEIVFLHICILLTCSEVIGNSFRSNSGDRIDWVSCMDIWRMGRTKKNR